MKITKISMGMPITVEIVDSHSTHRDIEEIFAYFEQVDNRFSLYKSDSEITLFNNGVIKKDEFSRDLQEIFRLADITREETDGYFDIFQNGKFDPSGIVKGWAIQNAVHMLESSGFKNFYIDAGGDVQVAGVNPEGKSWQVGIKNPFNQEEIIKVLALANCAIATSGTYIRGNHIYDPHTGANEFEIVSLSVIGPHIYDADRYATAAFAMGEKGIEFIYSKIDFEGYMIDKNGRATYTPGFDRYVVDSR